MKFSLRVMITCFFFLMTQSSFAQGYDLIQIGILDNSLPCNSSLTCQEYQLQSDFESCDNISAFIAIENVSKYNEFRLATEWRDSRDNLVISSVWPSASMIPFSSAIGCFLPIIVSPKRATVYEVIIYKSD